MLKNSIAIAGTICSVIIVLSLLCTDPLDTQSQTPSQKASVEIQPVVTKPDGKAYLTGEQVPVVVLLKYASAIDSLKIDFGDSIQNAFKIDTTTNNTIVKQLVVVYKQPGVKNIKASIKIKNTLDSKFDLKSISIGAVPMILNGKQILASPKQPCIDSSLLLLIQVIRYDTTTFGWYKNDTLMTNSTHKASDQLRFERLKKSDEGRYRCIVSNIYGADTSTFFILSFSLPQKPAILTHPQSQQSAAGSTVKFFCKATPPSVRYQWLRDGLVIGQEIMDSLILSLITLSDNNAKFKCRVSTTDTAIESNEAVLTVTELEQKPRILLHPLSTTVAKGEKAAFTVKASGTNISYQWQKNGTAIDSASSAAYETPAVTVSDNNARFRCRVSNTLGADTSNEAVLTIKIDAIEKPVIISQPVDITVTQGQEARFCLTASGKELKYLWKRNGIDISGAFDSTYAISVVTKDDNNSRFKCAVSNSAGLVDSREAVLTVEDTIVPPKIIKQPENKGILRGRTVTFTLEASGTDLSFQWQKNGIPIPEAKKASYTTPVLEKTDNMTRFKCIVSNSSGSQTSDEATLQVYYIDIKKQPVSLEVLVGQNALFSIEVESNPAAHYQWLKNGAVINGATAAQYSKQLVTLDDNTTEYACKVSLETIPFDTLSQSVKLLVKDSAIVITLHPADVGSKENETAEFSITATGSNLKYLWQKDGQNIGSNSPKLTLSAVKKGDNGKRIKCIVSNSTGSVNSNEALLSVYYIEILQQPKSPGTVVVGNSFSVSVDCQGNPQPRCDWRKDSISIGAALTLNVLSAKLSDAGNYQCRLYNDKGVEAYTNPIKVSVIDQAPRITQHPQNATAMVGSNVLFSVKAEGTNLKYEWIGLKNGPNSPDAQWNNVSKTDNGTAVFCRVSNSAGSVGSDTAYLTVQWSPDKISIAPTSLTITENDSLKLTATLPADKGNPLATLFYWYKNNSSIQTGNTVYKVAKAQISDSGSYFCAFTWNNQSQLAGKSNVVAVKVTEKNEPPVLKGRYYTLAINQGKDTFNAKTDFIVNDADDPNNTDNYKLVNDTIFPVGLKVTLATYDLVIENTMTAEQAKNVVIFQMRLYCIDKKGVKSNTYSQSFSALGPKPVQVPK
ncbi:MAG: hypothetical protein JW795_11770 [Chitinivibrionales bacterium]|nr:hypothetical protein [Chitinivibrionales bacterium]